MFSLGHVGARTLAMTQRFVHHVTQVLAPDCAPLFLTDGFREYGTALLTHYGYWVQPERHQPRGPVPKPRWMPLPQLLYAQVIKTTRRRRLVRISRRVVFGTLEAVNQVLVPRGWQINTSLVERVNLSLRQPLAQPIPTSGTGSAKVCQARTPAMAAGLTDHVWSLREVLLFRVPPWPQPQTS
jgi:hypothetical protein